MSRFVSGRLFAERYQFTELLHSDGSSEVWMALDKLARDMRVVVKCFSPQHPLAADGIEAFHLSMAPLIPLQHPHLLTPRYLHVEQGIPFLILPYCPGGSLRDQWCGTDAPFQEEDILRLLEETGSALAYLDSQSPPVLHGHLTPEDILCTEQGYLLADFGRSEAFTAALASGQNAESLPYCAPETQGGARPATAAADIFALGAMAYEMATGAPLPDALGVSASSRKKVSAARPAQISPAVWSMIERCLDDDPAMRPTADELTRWAIWQRKRVATAPAAASRAKRLHLAALHWAGLGAVGLALVILLASRLHPTNTAAVTTPASVAAEPAPKILLTLQGSNTIGAELAPALVMAFLKKHGATCIVRIPTKPDEMLVRCQYPGESRPCAIAIGAHGSSTAFEELAKDHADIGMASRSVKLEEIALLSKLGEITSPSCEHVLALDGITIIVNPANKLSTLTKAQVGDIFSGKITNWRQLHGPDHAIAVYARDDKSGTYDTFKQLILGKSSLVPGAERFESNDQLRQIVSSNPYGIGFVGLAYTKGVKALAIADGSLPIAPQPFTVATEDYPLSRRLFLYTPAMPKNQFTRAFVEFALSDAGQQIASDIGFVGQHLQVLAKSQANHTTERLNFNFRFRSGHAELDNKALRDLDRLVAFLQSERGRRGTLALYGYSDNRGDATVNMTISRQRAEAVARQLKARKLPPAIVVGRGAANPVAANDTLEGRDRNRRVEVWLQ